MQAGGISSRRSGALLSKTIEPWPLEIRPAIDAAALTGGDLTAVFALTSMTDSDTGHCRDYRVSHAAELVSHVLHALPWRKRYIRLWRDNLGDPDHRRDRTVSTGETNSVGCFERMELRQVASFMGLGQGRVASRANSTSRGASMACALVTAPT